MKILICGLPGSGKTTLAEELHRLTRFPHINADYVRTMCDDWDFSMNGRIRQAKRLRRLANKFSNSITDFVAPTEEIRNLFGADYIVWMDTIKESEYKDTNKIFEPAEWSHFQVCTKDAKKWAKLIYETLV